MPIAEQTTPCILLGEGPAKKDIASKMLELEVQEDHDLAGVFRIKMAIVREEKGLWKLLDEDDATPWKKIEIKMNVGGTEEAIFKGFVTQVRAHIDAVEGNSYLELAGMDATCVMSLEEVVKDWPGKSDSDIATQLFSKYQLSSTVESTGVVHEKDVSTILQRESDIQFLKRLARRNGMECGIDRGAAYFEKPRLDGAKLPELAAHFGKETNLTSFDANWNVLRPTTAAMSQVSSLTKEVESKQVSKSTLKELGKEKGPQAPLPDGKSPTALPRHSVVTGLPEMEKLVNGVVEESSWFVEAKGEVDGTTYGAILRARRLVPIKGVGELFSGIYYLTSVKHSYQPDRYIQTFTGRRNAVKPKDSDFGGGGISLPF